MDKLEELLKLIAEGKMNEAKALTDAIKLQIATLDSEIRNHEALKLEAIKSRDEAKAKIKALAADLGITEDGNFSDAIKAIKDASQNTKPSEELKIKEREIEQLKAEVAQANAKATADSAAYQQEILGVQLQAETATLLPKYKVRGGAAPYVVEAVKRQATYQDGKVVFKNQDGTTLRVDGHDATVEDMIKSMQQKEVESKESMFFDTSVQPSGAGSGLGGAPAEGDFIP